MNLQINRDCAKYLFTEYIFVFEMSEVVTIRFNVPILTDTLDVTDRRRHRL